MFRQSLPEELSPIYPILDNEFEIYSAIGLKQFFEKILSQYQTEKHPELIYALLEEYLYKHLIEFTPEKLETYLHTVGLSLPPDKLHEHRAHALNAYRLLVGAQLDHTKNIPLALLLTIIDPLTADEIQTLATQFKTIGDALTGKNFPVENKKILEKELETFWKKKLSIYFQVSYSPYGNHDKFTYKHFFELCNRRFRKYPKHYKEFYEAIFTNNVSNFIKLLETKVITLDDLDYRNADFCQQIIDRNRVDILASLLTHFGTHYKDSYSANVNSNHHYLENRTLLQYAASFGMRTEIIKLLLEHKADPNLFDEPQLPPYDKNYEGHETPLCLATKHGNVETAQLLLEHGADPNLCHEGYNAPLHYAVDHIFSYLTPLLLKHGADPNQFDQNGERPLHIITKNYRSNNNHHLFIEIAELLLKHGANPNLGDRMHTTALQIACERNNRDLITLLLQYDANPNLFGTQYLPPLCSAVKSQSLTLVQQLLDHKADPNQANEKGKNPLFYAIQGDQFDIAKLLLKCGADPEQSLLNCTKDVLISTTIAKYMLEKISLPIAKPSGRHKFFSKPNPKHDELHVKNELLQLVQQLHKNPYQPAYISQNAHDVLSNPNCLMHNIYKAITKHGVIKIADQKQIKNSKH